MTESRTRTDVSSQSNVAREVPPESTAGATRDVRSEPMVHEVERHDAPTQLSIAPSRRDRVRWGPVWAGLIVAVPTFLLLELATFALGWWDVGGGGSNEANWISGVVGLIAFFLGGLTAGASALWRGISDGLLHGILVWALGVVTIVFLTLFGGGALFGSLANVITQVGSFSQANLPDVQAASALETVRSGASWAVLGLGLSIAASALGGVLGAKMWPSKKDTEEHRAAAAR
ncbi:permease [Modestobacter sp. VKM Ac-2985]|uniref:permease n=1 Tax=Modestobacter sp. VKM Ac-2985 TaxID=3004139 RepID=UPI0022ABA908|nr:permease [Modestobacter sp. VKM Ac-2985]MCZ2837349.1 permease [Modestobacter sp. VKM Ac-2985]